ncbi:hypothetical protein [Nocardia abscessus]|uniref:hypothetical protein n=1 Tax=Nocardia abscessus TaxID=120957 RepID=UPI0002D5715D|nr:hypothetical protein [Nocardia abscessus]MCC3333528.1 hypothetical protein [Nocardia abscessus]
MISGRATLACISYAMSLVGHPGFDIARDLMLLSQREWRGFLAETAATYPLGSAEHEVAVEFQRLIRTNGAVIAA